MARPDDPVALSPDGSVVSGIGMDPRAHVLDTIAEGVVEIDPSGALVYENAASTLLLGHAPLAAPPGTWSAANGLEALEGGPTSLLEITPSEEGFYRTEAGRVLGVTVGLRADAERGQCVVAVLRDVTRRWEREHARSQELALAEARHHAFLQAVVDHVADPIFVKDAELRFVFLSRALCEMVGFPRESMLGKRDEDFFSPEQTAQFRARDREMFTSEARVLIDEEPITDATGRLHWLTTTKTPLRFQSADVTHLVGVIHDISRLKEAEAQLQVRNQELARWVAEASEALAEADQANRGLESFAYSVAHDLRAPLRAMVGFSSLVLEQEAARLSPDGGRCLEHVVRSAHRMSGLIDDLLSLSNVSRQELVRQPVDVSQLCKEILAELAQAEPRREVIVTVADGLRVDGDPRLLRIAFDNLLRNAWKFTRNRPCVHIEVGRLGDEIFVRDDGAGFDMAYAGSLFKPFSRLHSASEFSGSGIGLATVERIVRRHRGQIRAEGAVGRGATFWLRFG
jgi:PAS domain S-box-containing protein